VPRSITYAAAGVRIAEGDRMVSLIRPLAASTRRPGVLGGIGAFAGFFRFPAHRFRDPVLVAGTDGVGTKVKVAAMAGRLGTVGIDLVAMCVNDIVVHGAAPLFFLDYYATGRLVARRGAEIVAGIAAGCREAGCALLGGETAEMPSVYAPGEFDLAGFAVGAVERRSIVDGRAVRPGDVVVGLASSGLHSNGYSLARKVIFERLRRRLSSYVPEWGATVADELLRPTRIYVRPVLSLLRRTPAAAMAHVTGGGITGNLPRVLPDGLCAVLRDGSWPRPAVFTTIVEASRISRAEAFRTFNMGLGFLVVVRPPHVDAALRHFRAMGVPAYPVGEIRRRRPHEPPVSIA